MSEGDRTFAIYTIGHSTRTLPDFVRMLQTHGVDRLLDIRTIPRSRRNPQFNRETLPMSLAEAGIDYGHAPELGGRRRPQPDSPNRGWRNASFRGFADYMLTATFASALRTLMVMAQNTRGLAMMCAEAVPWRCHRSLIADALIVHGMHVQHLIGPGSLRPHLLTPWARVDGRQLLYLPAEANPAASPGKGGLSRESVRRARPP